MIKLFSTLEPLSNQRPIFPRSNSMASLTSLRKTLPKNPNSSLLNLHHHHHLFSTAPTTITPPPFSTFRAAQSSIVSLSDPTKIADILISQTPFSAFTRYRPIYPYAIRKLARANRYDLIDRVIQSHLSLHGGKSKKIGSLSLSEGFVIRFIMLYSHANMVDKSIALFYDYMGLFCKSEKFLCAILSALLSNSRFSEFHAVFVDAHKKMEVLMGVKAFNLKLRAHCEEGNVGFAMGLLEGKMEKEFGVLPDVCSYNVLFEAYLKGNDFVGFDRVFEEFLRKGLEGNVTSYKHRIVRLCKGGDCTSAKDLLDEMVGKGVKPNTACYNWIIYGYCRKGDLESAKIVLERMIDDGHVAPSSLTYYTLFRHMVQEGEYLSALDACKMILKRKWVPPFEAMEGLVKGLLEMSNKKEACKVVKKMKKRLKGPALDSWVKIEATLPWGLQTST